MYLATVHQYIVFCLCKHIYVDSVSMCFSCSSAYVLTWQTVIPAGALQYDVHVPAFMLFHFWDLNNVTTVDSTEGRKKYIFFYFTLACSLTELELNSVPLLAAGARCRMLGQGGALHVDSLEVPACLQEAYIVFERAVELETFSGALNLQWAGWQCCRKATVWLCLRFLSCQKHCFLSMGLILIFYNKATDQQLPGVLSSNQHTTPDIKRESLAHFTKVALLNVCNSPHCLLSCCMSLSYSVNKEHNYMLRRCFVLSLEVK